MSAVPFKTQNLSKRKLNKEMSNSVDSSSFDVEAQQSLLGTAEQAGLAAEAESSSINNARQRWRRIILVIRSTELFKLGANDITFSSSPSSSYAPTSIPDQTSDSVDSSSFDVEAQQSLLGTAEEAGLAAEVESSSINNARQSLRRIVLFIRSSELFKLGANDITSSSSPSPSYAPISIPNQDSRIVAPFEISVDSSHEDNLSARLEEYECSSIKLQRDIDQKKNITEIVKQKNLQELTNFGGVKGMAEALNTDLVRGISNPQKTFHCKASQLSQLLTTLFHSFLGAWNNYTILLLSCAAFLSLVFGIKEEGLHMGCFNGALLIVTIFTLVICTTIRKCWEERPHKKLENPWLSKGRKIIHVLVVRGGDFQSVKEIDIEVGDIVVLRKGYQVPADGLFVSTGQALELDVGMTKSTTIDEKDPFLFYGSRVINGDARMLVTSTHMDTTWGEMMSRARAIKSPNNKCKFEAYIHNLSTCTHISGLLISILIIIVMFLRYKAGKLDDERKFRPESKGEPTPVKMIIGAMKGIISGSRPTARVLTALLSVSLLGIVEGMPFAISIATIIWSRKTLGDKASERDYLACIKMASVTTIVTDKFGGLTEHKKEIVNFYVGQEFVSESSALDSNVLEALCDGIGTLFLESSGLDSNDCQSSLEHVISWAEVKLGIKRESVTQQCQMTECRPFQECCRVVQMKKNRNEKYLHCKGPPDDILSLCSHHLDANGKKQEIDGPKREMLAEAIRYMQVEEAEVIAFAYKPVNDFEEVSVKPKDLIFLAMISMKEMKKEETKGAVSSLMTGGIRTILASGDDVTGLQTIGENYGLITPVSDELVLTAAEFRDWTDIEKMDRVEKIRIMGNCLPSDKILLIEYLMKKEQVVALVAQQTMDAPALKQADVGLTFGTWSSEDARECSDINIWGGNCFSFLVKVIENGICFQENIRKFIQLQLIITISSAMINFTAIVFLGDAPLTAGQLLWLNLVVGLAGLALLTGPSTKTPVTMLPVESPAKLMTKAMWRNIALQVSYQTSIFVSLQHKGHAILGTDGGRIKSIIYNGFFLCQIFNKFIAREPERKNFFSGLLHSNCWFWVALIFILVCQAVFAVAEQVVGSSTTGLNLKLWGVCILIGLVSWLLDWIGKMVSNLTATWAAHETGN